MTVSSTTTPRKRYAGNGVTTEFAIPFPYNSDSSNLVVTHITSAGVETTLTETTHYTVNTTTDIVTITDLDYRPASGEYLSIARSTPLKQLLDLINNNAYDANLFEEALDLVVLMVQEARLNGISVSITSDEDVDVQTPAPVAGSVLKWDDDGEQLENGPNASQIASAQGYATTAQAARDEAVAAAAECLSSDALIITWF